MLNRFRGFNNRLELLTGRSLFRKTKVQVFRIGSVHMIADHRYSDIGSIVGCVSDRMYRNLLKEIKLPREISVLDVGSNVGGFPLLLHSLGHTFRKLTCVELNPTTYNRLHFNIKTNWPHASVLNRAVSSTRGAIEVRLGGGNTADSLRGSPDSLGDLHSIASLQLDDIDHGGEIDVLKMDIEHAEVDVLLNSGHARTLERTNALIIEIHPLERAEQIHAAIERTGLEHMAGSGTLVGQHLFVRRK